MVAVANPGGSTVVLMVPLVFQIRSTLGAPSPWVTVKLSPFTTAATVIAPGEMFDVPTVSVPM
ncbi:hypothetical protein D3C72_2197210 [compost metagenome]